MSRVLCGALALSASLLIAPAAQADFGFLPGSEGFGVAASKLDGSAATQAGSHPYALSIDIGFQEGAQPGYPAGDLEDLRLDLPPGLVENPSVVYRCTAAQFATPRSSPFEASRSGESCPDGSQVGVVAVHSVLGTRHFGVFSLTPPFGVAAELGFAPFGVPVVLASRIRGTGTEYGLTLEARDVKPSLSIDGLELTIWGTPWALSHDTERGSCLNEADPAEPWAKCSVGPPRMYHREAFLTLPTSCGGPLAYSVAADSWQGGAATASASTPALEGCGLLNLDTYSWGQPTTTRASTASGFEFNLEVNQEGLREPEGLAGSQIRDAVVSLPEGMTINPSVGAGLGVCTPAQYAAETAASAPGAACPNDSKIGDFRVESPLFEEALEGAIFLAQPYRNPFGSLIAVYLVAKVPARGVLVKVAGKLVPDPASGRLTAAFEGLPQLPYLHLHLFFREGQRAPLASPSACGSYAVRMDLTPWLDPALTIHHSSGFTISSGPGGGPCPAAGPPPFSPGAVDGSVNPNAGSYSPYYLRLTRTDAEQEITSYSAVLPPGLTGKIAGIPYCSDAALAAAKARSGTEELEAPSCPAASEIGHTVAGYGLGDVLDYAPGRLYLAGPYRGAPLSIAAVDSALVGPFDLGVIVVRSAIRIDRRTAQVSVDTSGENPFPHILDGIPIHLRDVRVYISRPRFTLNPTSCEPFLATSILTGAGTRLSDPSDDQPTAVTDPYQVTNCSALGFAPRLSLRLLGSARRGAHPALRAVVRERPGDANIGRAVVTLPRTEFLAENHIREICTPHQFDARSCPASSIYGHARAFTPLLSEPLEGPVYLRSNSAQPLPDLVAALRGDGGIAIDVVGRIDSFGGAMRGSFEALPDAPASKFIFILAGGRRGLLENSTNLCAAPSFATARFAGQDNAGEAFEVPLGAACRRHRGGQGRHHGGGRR